ncbi:MAG: hypothetical protein WCX61_01010 [Candidatus Peribacteraceae bacterium]
MAEYSDTDFVYVDPKTRMVLGIVEWSKDGVPVPRIMEEKEEGKGEQEKRRKRKTKRYYPWGTYKTMKRVYRLEGKEKNVEHSTTLDDALAKAVVEPFWN